MKDPARAAQTANVLAAVLDGCLRLMHPIIPFITETIWWRLNEVRPHRGFPDYLPCPPSPRLIHARWPTPGKCADDAEHVFPRIKEIVGAIRNLRNDYKVDPRKPVTVSIAPPGEEAAHRVLENRELIELLGTCRLNEVRPGLTQPPNTTRAAVNAVCDLYAEGLVDENAERERVAKRREELKKQETTLEARLANPGYVAKAPPALIKQTQDQLAAVKSELTKLG